MPPHLASRIPNAGNDAIVPLFLAALNDLFLEIVGGNDFADDNGFLGARGEGGAILGLTSRFPIQLLRAATQNRFGESFGRFCLGEAIAALLGNSFAEAFANGRPVNPLPLLQVLRFAQQAQLAPARFLFLRIVLPPLQKTHGLLLSLWL